MRIAAVACAAAACATTGGGRAVTPAAGTDDAAPVRIVDPAFGAAHSQKQEPMTLGFGVDQNGTELVYVLLDRAAGAGAAFVGDMAFVVTFKWRGTPIECRTRVLFEGDPRVTAGAAEKPGPTLPAAAAPTYATEIETYQPQRVSFEADDKELVCRKVARQVLRKQAVENDATSGETRRRSDPRAGLEESIAETVEDERCELVPVRRRAERWDYQVKLGFVPPNWSHLAARFSDRPLVESRPACYQLAESELGKQPIYRLTAVAYHRGAVAQRLPSELPSRGMVSGQRLRQPNESEQECMKRLRAIGGQTRPSREEMMGAIDIQTLPQCLDGSGEGRMK